MAVALLVAAGSGERLGAGRPKAFVVVAGRPMLQWSLDALRAAGLDDVVVAVPQDVRIEDGALVVGGDEVAFDARVHAVPGGVTRSQSVRAALAAAPPGDVVVHDAARPLVTADHVRETLAALAAADCAVAAVRVTDTVKEAGSDRLVMATLDRSRLWAIQTPQAFRREVLEQALAAREEVLAHATDDAWLVERMGGTVRVVESSPANFKVTTPYDLAIAEHLLADRLPRPPAA